MTFVVALFLESKAYLQWPAHFAGWAGLLAYFGLVVGLAWRARAFGKKWEVREWGLFAALFVAELGATLFIGVRLQPGQALPSPGSLESPLGPVLMVFSGVPWVLASGLLGSSAAVILAGVSGLLLALYDFHQPFIVVDFMLMGLLMGVAANQRFRTSAYRALRHPMVAFLGAILLFPGLYVLGVALGLDGELPSVLDFALTHVRPVTVAVGVAMFLGSLFAEVVAVGLPEWWGRPGPWLPSPGERSIEIRSLSILGPAVVAMIGVLAVVGWQVALGAAEDMLERRMRAAAEISAESIPLVVEVGHNLILQIAADERAHTLEGGELSAWLDGQAQLLPYFRELIALDGEGQLIASSSGGAPELALEEEAGVTLAQAGVPFQFYIIGNPAVSATTMMTFIAKIPAGEGAAERILVGRSALSANPFALNVLSSLSSMAELGGEGFLVDEGGLILYHPEPGRVLNDYFYQTGQTGELFDATGPTGARHLVFLQPVPGKPWSVVVTVPALAAQELALNIAVPLLGLLILLGVVLMVIVRVAMRLVTGSLRTLAQEAKRIAGNKDELASPLRVEGVDEVGEMRQAFEQMRVSLQTYLNEREQTLLMAQIGEQRLSAILESTPDPVLVTDAQNRLLLANSVAKEIFSNGNDLARGMPIDRIINQKEVVELLSLAEDEIQTREITLPDGSVYVAKAKAVMSQDQRRMGQVCVLRDVTRFKELDALKSDFVSAVSHDLRSPLTLMRGYATMVQMMGRLNEEQLTYLRKIEHGVDRMSHLITNLLDLGRIEHSILQVESVNVNELIGQTVGALQHQAEQKKLELVGRVLSDANFSIQGDFSLLSQAIYNLVENAIKYTEPGGKVQVLVHRLAKESALVIEVRDTGIGISPGDQLRLFEKFYRVPDKKAVGQRGSGLGLAIVKSIVELHKGRVWVQSEKGKGSSFFVRLPFEQTEEA